MIDRLFTFGFLGHDLLLGVLSRHLLLVKRFLLAISYLVLLAFFLPTLASFQRDFGEMAGNLLIVILFLSPLSALFRMPLLLVLMGLRRELGILMGCLALVHGIGYLAPPSFLWGTGQSLFQVSGFVWEKGIAAGIIGLVLILPLLLTSNTFSVRLLGGKSWKRLHRLAYPAFFFIVFHRFFMGQSAQSIEPFLEVLFLLGSYSVAKLLAWKPAMLPGFQENIVKVGVRYRQYRTEQVR